MKKRRGKQMLYLLLLFVVLLIVHTIWDNNRFIIAEQEIMINSLPQELEGYRILQISDLHEKNFGENQSNLIEAINSLSYDAIIFSGDMLDSVNSNNYKPFYTLIEGIRNKEVALFVPGNSDPSTYRLVPNGPYRKTDFIIGMEQRGVRLLESVYRFKKGDAVIHFIDFPLSIENPIKQIERIEKVLATSNTAYTEYFHHRKNLFQELIDMEQHDRNDVAVAISHYPIVDIRIDSIRNDPKLVMRDYDLIIAGHYHGGQIRLPFIGALFVPEAWYDRGGLFPPLDRVKGLWEYKGIKQYVSAGLGSSDAVPFLKFRMFNTPEINVLTLTSSENAK